MDKIKLKKGYYYTFTGDCEEDCRRSYHNRNNNLSILIEGAMKKSSPKTSLGYEQLEKTIDILSNLDIKVPRNPNSLF